MPSDSEGTLPHLSAGRRIFSFPVMIAGLLAVLAVLTVQSRFDDPDMWWHLKTGQLIWTTHHIPTTDIFSYTTHLHAYVPHEWLSQLLIYGAYRVAGYSGLMAWLCFFTAAILIAGYALCSRYSGNAKIAFLGALVIWLFSTVGLSIRPQMIGYLLLLVELLLLHQGITRSPRWFYALPPLFAVWVNCHGSFFLGLILAATFLFSSFFHFRTGSLVGHEWGPQHRRTLGLALGLSICALFLNPIGIHQILYPLDTLLHQPIGLANSDEWQALQLNDPRGLALLAVLGCIGLTILIRRSELFWHELLFLLLGTWLAAGHRRMLFVFGILVAPILCRLVADLWDYYEPERDLPTANAVLLVLSLTAVYFAFPRPTDLEAQVQARSPSRAVEFIQSHHLSGPIVNEYAYGGYLIWAAPDYPVFVDGRADVFEETGVLADFGNWAMLQAPPADLLNRYHVNLCLLSKNSPMRFVLPLVPGWTLAYSDDLSVVFVRIPTITPN
ncbi:MAG TPA: hypothetical protein VGN01_14335 [Acidobacteriaceae bacterium]